MRFELRPHSKATLLDRGIDVEKAKSVVRNPDKTESSFNGRMVARKGFEEGILEVVYIKKSKNQVIIITAYYAN